MMNWLKKWMIGRYGVDQLSLVLLATSLILGLITLPFHSLIVRLLPLILIILCYYRIFSKNTYKRQQENFKFIRFYTPLLKHSKSYIRRFKERKTHKFYKCPSCHQTLRVPKGRGKLTITCPKCKTSFHKQT